MTQPALRFALLVTGPCYGSQSASDAYRFACAVIEQGHAISHVFFYQDGVYNANQLAQPAADELHLQQAWVEFANQHHLTLDVCVAAALRRGICDQASAADTEQGQWNLAPPFCMTGLGQLAQAALTADRVVQF
ncbi:sulfurtransferase complex subunit TusD [Oceanisphaera pacifica]|uniref:Sulfurtransferase complex subunit TusD n=1 Tax=Oceanisphaera pacifica TaxID=2818389 RepID=A0ABS3NCM3_9GAMM|nr:sulfurtransferase complex subunit TusD [Oceanisphaera pacifica]MBO1518285.1 sulfurtransferase complex subunit TusD [Oceanisphaera pacifica]